MDYKIIERDIMVYNSCYQDSFDVYSEWNTDHEDNKDKEIIRHYEMCSIGGVVAYGFSKNHVMLFEFFGLGDDLFNDTQYDSAYLLERVNMLNRMNDWLLKNCERIYYYSHQGEEGFECGYGNFKKEKTN